MIFNLQNNDKVTAESLGLDKVDNTADKDKNVNSANKDGKDNVIDSTYLSYGGYYGSDVSINDITKVGVHRKWIAVSSDDGKYLKLTQSEQVAIIVTKESGLIKQYIICFGGEGITSNRMYWRSTNSQSNLTFSYNTPLQTLCYSFTPDANDKSNRIATTEWVDNGYLSKNGGTVKGTTNINGVQTVAYNVLSGTSYLLMYDVTDIYTSDGVANGFLKRGFSGFIYANRDSGYLEDHTAEINIAMSYVKELNSPSACLLGTNNVLYIPCIVYDNTEQKYYLALTITGKKRDIRLQGMFYGDYVGTVVTDITRYTVAYNNYTLLSAPNADRVNNIEFRVVNGELQYRYDTAVWG